ncbi:MAG: SLOG family protein [Candidatus Merdivicinus sp.]|jgi:uncharacterized phage-like protein YoqJ
MPRANTACFTGHRPQKLDLACGSDPQKLSELRHRLQNKILTAIEDGYTTFLCGMAQGVDIWAGEIVLSLREVFHDIRLIAVLPYPGMGKGWKPDWNQRLNKILRLSDEIIVLYPGYHRGCFVQRDRFLVDQSSRVIGILIEGSSGGTAYTVQYAEQKNRELDLILLPPILDSGAVSLS